MWTASSSSSSATSSSRASRAPSGSTERVADDRGGRQRPRRPRGAALRALRLERYSFTAVDARFGLGVAAGDEDEMLLSSRTVEPVRRGRLNVAELPPGAVVCP